VLPFLTLFLLKDLFIMKTTHIAALALIASAAGFNAFAASGDNYPVVPEQTIVSTLSRAEVHAEAVKATREKLEHNFHSESGEYQIGAPVQATGSALTRAAVRAQALKARGTYAPNYVQG
jgi:hypothetical protein